MLAKTCVAILKNIFFIERVSDKRFSVSWPKGGFIKASEWALIDSWLFHFYETCNYQGRVGRDPAIFVRE